MTDLLKTLVRMDGHTPMTINDSTKSVEIASSFQPDLITLDLMMPGLTGFEVCELLHGNPEFSEIPIVIVSASDDSESKARAMKAGATDYITKPFEADELMHKIRVLARA
jgi:putative two-component system response regulator